MLIIKIYGKINLSKLQEQLLLSLAKRNGFPNSHLVGNKNDVWHSLDSNFEVEICLVCGEEVNNSFSHEYDIIEHGLKHIQKSNLIAFL